MKTSKSIIIALAVTLVLTIVSCKKDPLVNLTEKQSHTLIKTTTSVDSVTVKLVYNSFGVDSIRPIPVPNQGIADDSLNHHSLGWYVDNSFQYGKTYRSVTKTIRCLRNDTLYALMIPEQTIINGTIMPVDSVVQINVYVNDTLSASHQSVSRNLPNFNSLYGYKIYGNFKHVDLH